MLAHWNMWKNSGSAYLCWVYASGNMVTWSRDVRGTTYMAHWFPINMGVTSFKRSRAHNRGTLCTFAFFCTMTSFLSLRGCSPRVYQEIFRSQQFCLVWQVSSSDISKRNAYTEPFCGVTATESFYSSRSLAEMIGNASKVCHLCRIRRKLKRSIKYKRKVNDGQ